MKITWDRTNIGENYPGITLPLTYSFVRIAYAHVYKVFLRLIGVESSMIEKHRPVLENMLGYLNGRVYYRIENWYTFLTFLPGYRFNRDFFESMLDPAAKKSNAPDRPIEMNVIASLAVFFRFLFLFFIPGILDRIFERKFKWFYSEFKQTKKNALSDESLITGYERTCDMFFSIWSYTIVNDFRVMIYFGVLTKLVNRFADAEGLRYLSHLKLRPESTRPLLELSQLAIAVNGSRQCRLLFQEKCGIILKRLQAGEFPNLYKSIRRYLALYGDRSANELKLEEPKFRENQEMFISLLSQYVSMGEDTLKRRQGAMRNEKYHYHIRTRNPLLTILISSLSNLSAEAMYRREKYRLRRGAVFGLGREVFLELGNRLVSAGDIKARDDVFYLYHDELIDYCRFHRLPENLSKLIDDRKLLLSQFGSREMPRRTETAGYPNNNSVYTHQANLPSKLSGIGTSRGIVRAEALVVETLDFSADYRGKILITRATDPGWTVLFPLIKGIVTEQGGVLSHASIVAREVGIPCIVQATAATDIIKKGDIVEIDGLSGEIKIFHENK